MGNPERQSIGFIGLGHMGKPMCHNLLKSGVDLVVSNRSKFAGVEMQKQGAVAVTTPAEVASRVDTIIIAVTDTAAVEGVLKGPGGIFATVQSGTLIIDMGTTLVSATKSLASSAANKNCLYVDAPVSGGTIGAQAGNLTIMAGGTDVAFKRALPILQILGDRITHVGPVGAGQVAKAANQIIVGLNIGAVAEALALAKAAGIDPLRVRDALKGGFADSRILDVHGKRMLEGDFTPGAKSTIQRKDMDQAIKLATELGLELPATSLSRDLYDNLIQFGGAELDHSALFKVIEKCHE